jgi:hypothetical protein
MKKRTFWWFLIDRKPVKSGQCMRVFKWPQAERPWKKQKKNAINIIQYCIKDAFQGTTGRYWSPEQQPILPTTTLLGKEGKETAIRMIHCDPCLLNAQICQCICPSSKKCQIMSDRMQCEIRTCANAIAEIKSNSATHTQNCGQRGKTYQLDKVNIFELTNLRWTTICQAISSTQPCTTYKTKIVRFVHNLAQPCTTCWPIWPWLPWPEHLVELQPINLPPLDLLLALHSIRSSIKCSACCVFLHFLLCCDRVCALCMFDLFSAKFFQIGSYEPLTLADSNFYTSRSFLKPRHLSSSQVYNHFNRFICVFRHVPAGIAV